MKKIHVLLIEDNPDDAFIIHKILSASKNGMPGFELTHTAQLSTGLEHLAEASADVVLLDLSLPDSQGLDTFTKVHARAPDVPIIVLSGFADEALAIKAVGEGAQDYLVKGQVEGSLLARSIRYAVERGRSEAALRKSQQLLRRTFASLRDAVLIINADTKEIADCNPVVSEMFGYNREELLGQTPHFLHADENALQKFKEHLDPDVEERRFLSGLESRMKRKDGTVFLTEHSVSPLEDEHGRHIAWVNVVHDITERVQAEEALRESEERYALAVLGANDGLWDWNLTTDQIYFSPRWKSMLGYEVHEIGSSPDEWFSRIHPKDLERVKAKIDLHCQEPATHFEDEHRMLHRDGSYCWVLSRGLAVQDATGKTHRMAGSQTDITDRKAAEEALQHDAFHDALTGIHNRAFIMNCLRQAIENEKQQGNYLFAVLFLDLDRFKVVNDSLGHMVGDHLLIAIARRLKACLRPDDTIARLGGDEFVLLLDDIHSADDAIRTAERIKRELAKPIDLYGHREFTTASIGIVLSSTGYDRPEDLLRDADAAMYCAKTLGRARHVLFDPSIRGNAVARLQLEADLRRAIERQEFLLYYQPIVSADSEEIVGSEALLRWQHARRGLLPTEAFTPLAEELGLIAPIGEWVLRRACADNRTWHDAGHASLRVRVAVNLSTRQFEYQNIPRLVKQVLSETGIPSQSLELEITESAAMMQDTQFSATVLNELSVIGTPISIDDFGTGYSSLDYLKLFPIQTVKIDQSFVSGITHDARDEAIVAAIINMAHNLEMRVIAEGVETREQLAFLRAHGCDEIQGHLFSAPVTAEELVEILQRKHCLA